MDDPVVAQLAAYNAHDVDAFVACYATDAEIVDGAGVTLMAGHAEMREKYAELFAHHPDVHADVGERLRERDWVVDHEVVHTGTGARGYLVAYRVHEAVIDRVVILGG
ncbi:nuclear transport factor 2 family protein [Nocardioides sp. MAHUQ-72]|uniref:nuclear transport factor 2 family protein n=1 Tax=unclassified Nocardioides TaxID=2615069 RepID=UPI0036230F05